MHNILPYITSSIGKKIIMALTGLALFAFVIVHLLGNLQIFWGQKVFNDYAAFLHSMPGMVWTVRFGLLILAGIHIWTAVSLTLANRRARPAGYDAEATIQATYASRTMRWSGVIILAFVIYHLLHFTAHVTHPAFAGMMDSEGRHDTYGMVVAGFSSFYISAFYIGAIFLLAMHLAHGIGSLLQTLGWRNSSSKVLVDRVSFVVAALIFLGYISIPLAVLTGLIH